MPVAMNNDALEDNIINDKRARNRKRMKNGYLKKKGEIKINRPTW